MLENGRHGSFTLMLVQQNKAKKVQFNCAHYGPRFRVTHHEMVLD